MDLFYFCSGLLIFVLATTSGNTIVTSTAHVCGNDLDCYLAQGPTELILNSTDLVFNYAVFTSVDIYGLYDVNVSCSNGNWYPTNYDNITLSLSGFTVRDCYFGISSFAHVSITNMTFVGYNTGLIFGSCANVTLQNVMFRDIVTYRYDKILEITNSQTAAHIENCVFSQNTHNDTSATFFQIINIIAAPRVVITSCLMEDNDVFNGGLLYLSTTEAEITNSTFIRNKVTIPSDSGCKDSLRIFGKQLLVDSCVFENNTCLTNTSAVLSYPSFSSRNSNITIRNTRFSAAGDDAIAGTVFSCDDVPTNFTCGLGKCYISTSFDDCNTNVTCENDKYCVLPTVSPTTNTPTTIPTTSVALPNQTVLSSPFTIGGDFIHSGTATIVPGGFLLVEGSIVIPPNTTFIIDYTLYNKITIGDTREEVMRSNNGTITGDVTLVPPQAKQCVTARLDRTFSSIFVIASKPDSCGNRTESVNVGLVLGITFGVLALMIIGLLVIFFVRKLRHAVVPYSLRRTIARD